MADAEIKTPNRPPAYKALLSRATIVSHVADRPVATFTVGTTPLRLAFMIMEVTSQSVGLAACRGDEVTFGTGLKVRHAESRAPLAGCRSLR